MLFSGQMQSFTPDLSFIWFSFHVSFLRLLLLSHQLILLTRTFVVVCDKWKPCKGNVPSDVYGIIASEAIVGEALSCTSDIYGLGGTLYELLHG